MPPEGSAGRAEPPQRKPAIRRRHYVRRFVHELERLLEEDNSLPEDLEDELGAPDVAAARVHDLLPRVSPWAAVVGPVYTTSQVERLLDCSRQAIGDRVKRHTLLALHTSDRQLAYPIFQFAGTTVLPGLSEILEIMDGSVDDWTLVSWLRASQPTLGESVLDALAANGGVSEEVGSLARSTSDRWKR